jgi:hypothetical protein
MLRGQASALWGTEPAAFVPGTIARAPTFAEGDLSHARGLKPESEHEA